MERGRAGADRVRRIAERAVGMVPEEARADLRASLDRIRKVRTVGEAVAAWEAEIDHLLRVVVPAFVRYPAPVRRTGRARAVVGAAGLAAAGIQEIGAYGSALSGGAALPVGAPAAMAAGLAAIALEAYVATSLRVHDLRTAGVPVEAAEVAADVARAMAGLPRTPRRGSRARKTTSRGTRSVTRPLVRAITRRMLMRTGKGVLFPVVGAALSALDAQSTVVAIRRMPIPPPAQPPAAPPGAGAAQPVAAATRPAGSAARPARRAGAPEPGARASDRPFVLPAAVVHADWSVQPARRWVARARLGDDGRYVVTLPEVAGPTGAETGLLEVLGLGRPAAESDGVLAGFDFPIGLPAAYAELAGIDDFRAALGGFGVARWAHFFEPAREEEEISVERPFFPAGRGKAGNAARLAAALGLGPAQLLRRCDRAHAGRRAAAALFLTQGAQQAGKAAITGWRDLLQPALSRGDPPLRLWPFDGLLTELLARPGLVVAEVYPTEFHTRLGIRLRASAGKGSASWRTAQAPALERWAAGAGVKLSSGLRSGMADGFQRGGDHAFDAVVGLLGMLETLLGQGPPEPSDPQVRRVEGWMLGLAP
jgi:hypothetical protein